MTDIWIITLFSQYFKPLFETGVVGSALRGERGECPKIHFVNPSDFSDKGFKGVDASPYGGGAGQVMRGDVLERTLLDGIVKERSLNDFEIVYLGPRGECFNQEVARRIQRNCQSGQRDYVFLCGRYEGVDERFLRKYVTSHLSLGDFVLSGGEVALMTIIDSVFRLMPGVLGNEESPLEESFDGNGLEFPQFTKPQLSCGENVPDILMSGHHEKIRKWRQEQRVLMTKKHRPDLLEKE